MLRRYLLYLLRWQCSTPILAPVIAYFKHSPHLFGSAEDWIGSVVANIIGGLIFFWVDRFIFALKDPPMPLWSVQSRVPCVECGREGRGYRLVKSAAYDRMGETQPEYRCEQCSTQKASALQAQGVVVE